LPPAPGSAQEAVHCCARGERAVCDAQIQVRKGREIECWTLGKKKAEYNNASNKYLDDHHLYSVTHEAGRLATGEHKSCGIYTYKRNEIRIIYGSVNIKLCPVKIQIGFYRYRRPMHRQVHVPVA
jgi:hypothetical protein